MCDNSIKIVAPMAGRLCTSKKDTPQSDFLSKGKKCGVDDPTRPQFCISKLLLFSYLLISQIEQHGRESGESIPWALNCRKTQVRPGH